MGSCSDALYFSVCLDLLPYLSGDPHPDRGDPTTDVKAVFAAALRNSIVKKFIDEVGPEADSLALAKFRESNAACRDWSLDQPNAPWVMDYVLGEVRRELYNFYFPGGECLFSESMIWQNANNGPGTAAGVEGESFLHKRGLEPLTASSAWLFDSFAGSIARSYPRLLADMCRVAICGEFGRVMRSSRLTFAPKNAEVSRAIQPQPSVNMEFQKGIDALQVMRLKEFYGIDLRIQSRLNQELARRGSRTGRMGTIDLESASDRNSITMLREVLHPVVFRWLSLGRLPEVEYPNGEVEPLHMFSTMGCGFTFSLQTVLYCAVVAAVYRLLEIPMARPRTELVAPYRFWDHYSDPPRHVVRDHGNYGVFGDDIIVLAEAYGLVCRSLEFLGHKVNATKSFNEGCFRESCGADWFNGTNIRGVYCKSLKTDQDVLSLTNRLILWTTSSGISLPSTLETLYGMLQRQPPLVPHFEGDQAGLKVPLEVFENEARTASSGKPVRRTRNGLFAYGRYRTRPKNLDFDDGFALDSKYNHCRNEAAAYLAALRGDLRRGHMTIRSWVVRHHYRWAITPCWEDRRLAPGLFDPVGYLRWLSGVETFLTGNVESQG
jgi:hypothetical protein